MNNLMRPIGSLLFGANDGGQSSLSTLTDPSEICYPRLTHIYEIIGFVYQYLKLLRQNSPQEWIFKELQDIANMEFRYAEEQPQDDYAAELAEGLLVYPPKHVIYGDYAYDVWDAEFIKYVLDFFRPENMRVDVVTKSFQKSDVASLRCKYDFGTQILFIKKKGRQ
ncbi:hypothetical protein BC332_23814 [Capsicum chinense]|nr:hypothetical protein BC332_23814 [Capsicum chinense]